MNDQTQLPPLGAVLHSSSSDKQKQVFDRGFVIGALLDPETDQRSLMVVADPALFSGRIADQPTRDMLCYALQGTMEDEIDWAALGLTPLTESDIPEKYRDQWQLEMRGLIDCNRFSPERE